jgi:GMP synthase (glutamine-hydrolysing)
MPIIVLQHGAAQVPGRLGLTLRDHGKKLDLRRLDLPASKSSPHVPVDFDGVDGVISLGGAPNVTDIERHPWMPAELEFLKEAHRRQLPIVGICLGHQLIAKALGGEVGVMDKPEFGMVRVDQHPVANTDTILAGVPWRSVQFQDHGQEVKTLPPGATVLQYSAGCKVQSFRVGLRTYGFQYHFEYDPAMIADAVRGATSEFAATGQTRESVLADVKTHGESFSRLSDRLCVNLTSLMFPMVRARTG